MQRQLGADLEDLKRGVGTEDVVHDHDTRAVHDAHAHRGVGAGGQALGVDERPGPQLVEIEVRVSELEQTGAELVLVRVAVLLDEAVGLERLQQAVHGWPGEAEPIRDLADAQSPRSAGEDL